MVKSYSDALIERLKDPEYAVEYLNACLDEKEPQVFLAALKYVAEAQMKSLSNLATKAKLNRENLYRMLSEKGNPEFNSLTALLDTLGLQFDLKLKKKSPKKKTQKISLRKSRKKSLTNKN